MKWGVIMNFNVEYLKYFLIYFLIINIIGFLSMGLDKYKAKHNLWRTPEKTLLLIPLFLGSIGSLIGMYTFSHYLAFIIISNLLISYFLFYIANKYFINRKKNKNIDYSWLGGIIFLLIGIYRLI